MPGTISETAAAVPVAADVRPGIMSAWQRVTLALAAIELAVLFAPTVAWLFERWTRSVWDNAHGLLIPPVAGYFAYQELKRLRHVPSRSSGWGFLFLAPALALHALDAGMHTQLLSAISLVLALPGLSLLLFGVQRTKAIAFPLVFMGFALPLPLALTEGVVWQLRLIATAGAERLVPMLGIPVFVEGTTLHMAQGALQIADACSGFSTLYAAVSVAFLMAYMTPVTWRRVLLLTVAAPLAIAANLLRVVVLVVLVVWQGQEILETFVHPLSGMMTFALALPVLFWLGGDSRRQAES
jgi:exosortase